MELERGKAKGRGLACCFFLGRPEDAGQPEKNGKAWRGLGR